MPDPATSRRSCVLSDKDIKFLERLGTTANFKGGGDARESSGVRTSRENGIFPIIGMALTEGNMLLDDTDPVDHIERKHDHADIFGNPVHPDDEPVRPEMLIELMRYVASDSAQIECPYLKVANLPDCMSCPVFNLCPDCHGQDC